MCIRDRGMVGRMGVVSRRIVPLRGVWANTDTTTMAIAINDNHCNPLNPLRPNILSGLNRDYLRSHSGCSNSQSAQLSSILT